MDRTSKSNLKIEALCFMRALVNKHRAADFGLLIAKNGGHILDAVGDSNYKIQAEALRCCGELTMVLRQGSAVEPNMAAFASKMYSVMHRRLASQDQDLEVKEAAIIAAGLLLSAVGDIMSAEMGQCLPVLLDRLRNETTRVTTLKTLARIANSPLNLDVTPLLSETMMECAVFLRKNDRPLKQAALNTLDALVTRHASAISTEQLTAVVNELASLLSDTELHLSHLSLRLCVSMVKAQPACLPLLTSTILPRALLLVESPLLQGVALESLIAFFVCLAQGAGLDPMLKALYDILAKSAAGGSPLPRQSLSSLAQCFGSLVVSAEDEHKWRSFNAMLTALQEEAKSDSASQRRLVLLLSVGEAGRRVDTSKLDIRPLIFTAFDSASEEVKSAAACALGNLAVGSMSTYVPFILEQISAQPKYQYLLLQSLKEIISRQSTSDGGAEAIGPFVENVMGMMIKECDSEEEGVRNMAAECLGKLALLHPAIVLPRLQAQLSSETVNARASAVYALKFTITDRTPTENLAPVIGDFLGRLRDDELRVRRAALVTLNSAAHNKPALIRGLLAADWLLPALYAETVEKPELVRTVNLGPFQHKVDDGAELRKLSLACMDTLLERCPQMLESAVFLTHVKDRLADASDDIKQVAHQLLCKMAVHMPAAVLEGLDPISEPLDTTMSSKTKDNATKQDVERHEELKRSAMRTIVELTQLQGWQTCLKFQALVDKVQADGVTPAAADAGRKAP
mmetsp:Transcript_17629/g.38279  ORF Transcript_17629/g.38279 Transcript_17629/m.38279 type:complete len:742 (-) Transcript_17629:24-2249(-)